MVVRTNMVLVIVGVLFALVGLFAPALNIGPAATPVSLFQIVNQMTSAGSSGGPVLPPDLTVNANLVLGLVGAVVLMGAVAFGLALFKMLRSSLIPSAIMAGAAGYLMFSLVGMKGLTVAVPQSYGWILMIAGPLVSTVTGIFALFGAGPNDKSDDRSTKPKDLGYMAHWTPGTQVEPSVKAADPDAEETAPTPSPVKKPPKQPEPRAPEPKAVPPAPEPKVTPPPAAAKPEKAEKAPADEPKAKAGVSPPDPDTIAAMAANGLGNEEPTESGGWVLSGFDSNGMAVRLNISDLDLRVSDEGILIGRNSKQCRLVLNDDSVSRRHARLSGTKPLTIEDLDSANGTLVDRERLAPGQKAPIEPGMAIEIGAVRLTLVRS